MAGLTYDAGALIAADRNDSRMWAIHKRALLAGTDPVIPAVVLAQAWRGGPQPDLVRLVRGCQIEPLDTVRARQVGGALARSRTADVPDATVVVSALLRADAIVTGDRQDLEHIAQSLGRHLNLIAI